jgi:hypothetical protein
MRVAFYIRREPGNLADCKYLIPDILRFSAAFFMI